MPGSTGNRNKATVKTLANLELSVKALELRKAGHTYQEIADKVGYKGPQWAYDAVQKALKRTLQQPTDDVRKMECERLDRMQLALWERVTNGDLDAVDAALRVMNRRAKLLGLDAPQRIAHSDPDGNPFLTGFAQALTTAYGDGPAGPPALPDSSS